MLEKYYRNIVKNCLCVIFRKIKFYVIRDKIPYFWSVYKKHYIALYV